jgi:isoleucyl-tRNA synthetase
MADARRVVELGRSARSAAGVNLRQPLPQLVVEGAGDAERHADLIAAELRVKAARFGAIEGASVRAKPNLPLLGPKLGKELPGVRHALAEGRFERLADGGVRVEGRDLTAEEVFVERTAPDGWALAEHDGLAVAIETRIDAALALEGRALDTIRELQTMRKEAGLDVTDRIAVCHDGSDGLDEVFAAYGERIAGEVLAVRVERRDGARLAIAAAPPA